MFRPVQTLRSSYPTTHSPIVLHTHAQTNIQKQYLIGCSEVVCAKISINFIKSTFVGGLFAKKKNPETKSLVATQRPRHSRHVVLCVVVVNFNNIFPCSRFLSTHCWSSLLGGLFIARAIDVCQ